MKKRKVFPLEGPWPDKNNLVQNDPAFQDLDNQLSVTKSVEDAVDNPLPKSAKDEEELRRKSSNKFMVNVFDNIFLSMNADAVLKRFFNLFRKTK